MLHRLSIRSILGSTIVVMGALIILLAGFNLWSAIGRYRAAERVVSFIALDDHVFGAMVGMRTERGTIVSALAAAGAADTASIARMTENRDQSEASFALAAPRLDDIAAISPQWATSIARLRTARAAMITLRSHVDMMLRQDMPARDAAVARSAAAISLTWQDALNAVNDQLENATKLFNPAVDQLVALKRSAWAVRLYGGSLALHTLTAAISGHPWAPPESVAAAADRGRMELAWSEMTQIAARPEMPTQLTQAMARASEVFPAAFNEKSAEAVKTIADHPGQPLVAFLALQGYFSDAYDRVNSVARLALAEATVLAASQAAWSRWMLLLSALEMLVALSLTIGGYLIAVRRISAPISTMTWAMRRLADHDLETSVPGRDAVTRSAAWPLRSRCSRTASFGPTPWRPSATKRKTRSNGNRRRWTGTPRRLGLRLPPSWPHSPVPRTRCATPRSPWPTPQGRFASTPALPSRVGEGPHETSPPWPPPSSS